MSDKKIDRLKTKAWTAIVMVLWAVALVVAAWPEPESIPETDWNAAEKIVDSGFEKGEAVLVLPAWLDGADHAFPGKPLFLGEPAAAEKAAAYEAFWIVSTNKIVPSGWKTISPGWEAAGKRLFVTKARPRPRDRAEAGLLSVLREAEVYLEDGNGKRTKCDVFQAGAWHCPGPAWNYVGPVEQVIEGRSRLCVWAHPRSGRTLVISFDSLYLAAGMSGGFGLSDAAATTPGGMPVRFGIDVDGRQAFSKTISNRIGWHEYSIPVKAAGRHSVAFKVFTLKDGKRHFCFTASFNVKERHE